MDEMRPDFLDSAWYCYANSAAMLLSSIGEHISPRRIEPLTGVGLGASMKGGFAFFGELTTPDRGLSSALTLLGFSFEENVALTPDEPPFDRLETMLRHGPVIIGPLDMSELLYNPMRPKDPGADHYVLVHGMAEGCFILHDPAGFAHVRIGRKPLARAWRAESVGYKCGHYRSWFNPVRVNSPSQSQIYQAAILQFGELYRQAQRQAARQARLIGREALLALADVVSAKSLSPAQCAHLVFFALPLGAKRAIDYAAFFGTYHPQLRKIKLDQAAVFGRCQSLLTGEAWSQAAAELKRLADTEASIKEAILKA